MCDSAEGNWVWSLRDRRTGRAVTSSEGFSYFFADEDEARAMAERLGRQEIELVQTREPGA
ncbi:MAG TPA: hypothetical protein VGL23_19650 [Chloroflexota bacterium]|jgi:hypothetical protein